MLLDEACRAPLTVIRAPAGAGKTTATALWVSTHSEPPGVWITLDASGASRLSLWTRVIDSLVDSGLADPDSVLASQGLAADAPDEVRPRLLRGLRLLDRDIRIVIDDFHHARDPEVSRDLAHVLRHVDSLSVIVLSRVALNLESQLDLEVSVIGPEDLLLTESETLEVLDQSMGSSPPDTVRAIHDALGGWPLAVRRAAQELGGNEPDHAAGRLERIAAATATTVGRNLVESLTDPGLVEFALRTSIADRASDDLVAAFNPGTDFVSRLHDLEAEGFGWWEHVGSGRAFRLQPLLRTALRGLLEERMPTEVASLRAVYARWLNENGRALEALVEAAGAEDWDFMESVYRRHHTTLLQLHAADVTTLVDHVPHAELVARPYLAILHATAHIAAGTTNPELIASLTIPAISLLSPRATDADPVELVGTLTAVMAAQRMGGRFEQAAVTAQRVVAARAALTMADRQQLRGLLPLALNQAAVSFLFVDRFAEADQLLSSAVAKAHRTGAATEEVLAAGLRAYVSAAMGNIPEAQDRIRRGHDILSSSGGVQGFPTVGLRMATAIAALEQFDPDSALDAIRPSVTAESAIGEFWPIAVRIEALALLTQGNAFEALGVITQREIDMARWGRTSEFMRSVLEATRVELHLALGEVSRAQRIGAQLTTMRPRVALTLARLALAQEQPHKALGLIGPHLSAPGPRVRAEALLLAAVGAQRAQMAPLAADTLSRAHQTILHNGIRFPLLLLSLADRDDILRTNGSLRPWLEDVPAVISAPRPPIILSRREQAVLGMLARSGSTEQIAASLFVSPNTVKTQIRSIYRKLGARTRQQAIIVAHEHGLIGGGLSA